MLIHKAGMQVLFENLNFDQAKIEELLKSLDLLNGRRVVVFDLETVGMPYGKKSDRDINPTQISELYVCAFDLDFGNLPGPPELKMTSGEMSDEFRKVENIDDLPGNPPGFEEFHSYVLLNPATMMAYIDQRGEPTKGGQWQVGKYLDYTGYHSQAKYDLIKADRAKSLPEAKAMKGFMDFIG